MGHPAPEKLTALRYVAGRLADHMTLLNKRLLGGEAIEAGGE
jgi:hypothetical protein